MGMADTSSSWQATTASMSLEILSIWLLHMVGSWRRDFISGDGVVLSVFKMAES